MGIIAIDTIGRVGASMNTAGMARAYRGELLDRAIAAVMKDEPFTEVINKRLTTR